MGRNILDATIRFLPEEFTCPNVNRKINFSMATTPFHARIVSATVLGSLCVRGELESMTTATVQIFSTTSGMKSIPMGHHGRKGFA
jgi:hypothetical protein